MRKERVLIIKTGYTEVLENTRGEQIVSLGDVVRTTPLLHLYKDKQKYHVTWLTDEKALPLLEGNSYIDHLISLNFTSAMHLLSGNEFDTVINLEKNYDICKFANQLQGAWKRYGFRFDHETQTAEACDRAFEILSVASRLNTKKKNSKFFQELLFEMVGEKWNKEGYVLGYKPKTLERHDIGLNTKVGQKWPTKAWPDKNWDRLEDMLKESNLKVSRQDKQSERILNDLNSYMDWINSCGIIISPDTLGLHLALGFNKKTIGIFGPTSHQDIYSYGEGTIVLPEKKFDCSPCFLLECNNNQFCLEDITPEKIFAEVQKLS